MKKNKYKCGYVRWRGETREVRWDGQTMMPRQWRENTREKLSSKKADLQRRADRCDVWCPVSMEG